jgi:secreted trypsin-like serine protease
MNRQNRACRKIGAAVALACAASSHAFGQVQTQPATANPEPIELRWNAHLPADAARARASSPEWETAKPDPNDTRPKVVGGKPAKPGEFPWQVALILSDSPREDSFRGLFCGGTLIASRWVLTAAHCTYEGNPESATLPPVEMAPAKVDVYVGSIDFSHGRRISVKNIIRHQYNRKTRENDLALLELAAESETGIIKLSARAGAFARVVGWGSTQRGIVPPALRERADKLLYATLDFKETLDCNRYYVTDRRNRLSRLLLLQGKSQDEARAVLDTWLPLSTVQVTDNMFCAGTDGAQDACFGDSGGPLVIKSQDSYLQVGIVSWGPDEGCGLADLFGVYVNLERYTDWIAENTR